VRRVFVVHWVVAQVVVDAGSVQKAARWSWVGLDCFMLVGKLKRQAEAYPTKGDLAAGDGPYDQEGLLSRRDCVG